MNEYSLKQLLDNNIISKKLKQYLSIQRVASSSEIIEISKNKAFLKYLYSSKKELCDELKQLATILPDLYIDNQDSESEQIENGLQITEKNNHNTIGNIAEKILSESEEPILLDDLVAELQKSFPNTYALSVRVNLNGDPQNRFVFFISGHCGLKHKNYSPSYVEYSVAAKKRMYAEERILQFAIFIEEKHRSPQPHGLDEEESLYRWYLDFIKSKSIDTKEQRLEFQKILHENAKYVYTPIEYSYKKNCDLVKLYVAYSGRYPFTNSGDIRSVRW